jgi:hypothetical protein
MKMTSVKRYLALLVLSLAVAGLMTACSGSKAEPTTSAVSLGQVQLNAHPASLEGKTVVLRWNGKPNGDKLLTQVGELLTQQVKDVKIIKLWETDPETAASSESTEVSEQFAAKIAALAPNLVIASQAD